VGVLAAVPVPVGVVSVVETTRTTGVVTEGVSSSLMETAIAAPTTASASKAATIRIAEIRATNPARGVLAVSNPVRLTMLSCRCCGALGRTHCYERSARLGGTLFGDFLRWRVLAVRPGCAPAITRV
jgi:hypothetical protein